MLPLVGWPPHCVLRAATGIPCPLCGMTTGVLATLHGDVGRALAANPAAPLLLVAVAVTVLVRLSRQERLAARWRSIGLRLLPLRVPALGLLWLFELRRFALR